MCRTAVGTLHLRAARTETVQTNCQEESRGLYVSMVSSLALGIGALDLGGG
jgi:hypothetical protein